MVAVRGFLQLYREVNPGMFAERRPAWACPKATRLLRSDTLKSLPRKDTEGLLVRLFLMLFLDRSVWCPAVAP